MRSGALLSGEGASFQHLLGRQYVERNLVARMLHFVRGGDQIVMAERQIDVTISSVVLTHCAGPQHGRLRFPSGFGRTDIRDVAL